MATRNFLQADVEAELRTSFTPAEIADSEKAMKRWQMKKEFDVDPKEIAKVHCALTRIIRARGLMTRVTPEQVKEWLAKVQVKVSKSFKVWVVPAGAPELNKLPREAFVDHRAVLLPAGTSLDNQVLVHINVPPQDLPYGLETLSLEKNQTFDLPEAPPAVSLMNDALPSASADLPTLPASMPSPVVVTPAAPQSCLAFAPHVAGAPSLSTSVALSAAAQPPTVDTEPAAKRARILQVKNSDAGTFEETMDLLARELAAACGIANFASVDRHDPKSFKGVLKKFVPYVVKSNWSHNDYPEEAKTFISMAIERLIDTVLSGDVTPQAMHAFFKKDLPEIIDTLQPAFDVAPFIFPKRFSPVVSIATYDYQTDPGIDWGYLSIDQQSTFEESAIYDKWYTFRVKSILRLLALGSSEGDKDRSNKIALCAAKIHLLDEKEQAILKALLAKKKKPAPVGKGIAPTEAGPTDVTGKPVGAGTDNDKGTDSGTATGRPTSAQLEEIAQETADVDTVTPLEEVGAGRTHIDTSDGSHPSEAAAPMVDGTVAAPAAIPEVIKEVGLAVGHAVAPDEAANEGAGAAQHAIREVGGVDGEVAQILPESGGAVVPVIAELVASTTAVGPT